MMKNLINKIKVILAILAWPFEPDVFVNPARRIFHSRRYNKFLTVPEGFECDGSTGSPNIGLSWLAHDYAFKRGKWDDGTPIKWREANHFMQDLMIAEGQPKWTRNLYRRGVRSIWSLKAWKEKRAADSQQP